MDGLSGAPLMLGGYFQQSDGTFVSLNDVIEPDDEWKGALKRRIHATYRAKLDALERKRECMTQQDKNAWYATQLQIAQDYQIHLVSERQRRRNELNNIPISTPWRKNNMKHSPVLNDHGTSSDALHVWTSKICDIKVTDDHTIPPYHVAVLSHHNSTIPSQIIGLSQNEKQCQQLVDPDSDGEKCTQVVKRNEWFPFQNLISLILGHDEYAGNPEQRRLIANLASSLKNPDPVLSLIQAHKLRPCLLQITLLVGLEISDALQICEALKSDDAKIYQSFYAISISHQDDIERLTGDDAQNMLDLMQTIVESGQTASQQDTRRVHRLIRRLSSACGILPESLFIDGVIVAEREIVCGGGYADLYRGLYEGEIVALKRMRIFQTGEERNKVHMMICNEALLWKKLSHPYVLPFLGVDSVNFPPQFCLVSPWMEHGTILRYIQQYGHINIDRYLYEIAQGLEYLHSQNIVHGDLRGANILVDDGWHARIADFGLAILTEATLDSSHIAGAIRWMAPELLDPTSFGFTQTIRTYSSDVYSFACTCLELYTGRPPHSNISNEMAAALVVIRGGRPELRVESPGKIISPAMKGFISTLWVQNPEERPTAIHILKMMQAAMPDF